MSGTITTEMIDAGERTLKALRHTPDGRALVETIYRAMHELGPPNISVGPLVPSTESLLQQILAEMRHQSLTLRNIYTEVDRIVRRQEQKK